MRTYTERLAALSQAVGCSYAEAGAALLRHEIRLGLYEATTLDDVIQVLLAAFPEDELYYDDEED